MRNYLDTISDTLNSGNIALDLRILGGTTYRQAAGTPTHARLPLCCETSDTPGSSGPAGCEIQHTACCQGACRWSRLRPRSGGKVSRVDATSQALPLRREQLLAELMRVAGLSLRAAGADGAQGPAPQRQPPRHQRRQCGEHRRVARERLPDRSVQVHPRAGASGVAGRYLDAAGARSPPPLPQAVGREPAAAWSSSAPACVRARGRKARQGGTVVRGRGRGGMAAGRPPLPPHANAHTRAARRRPTRTGRASTSTAPSRARRRRRRPPHRPPRPAPPASATKSSWPSRCPSSCACSSGPARCFTLGGSTARRGAASSG